MSWQQHFKTCVDNFEFRPWEFQGEDLNLRAFADKQTFADWFGQEPGEIGQPYRDEGFYVREFTELSSYIQPRRIVEFGTSLGLGTLLFRILNPDAQIITVDDRFTQFLPGNIEVATGYLAKHQQIRAAYVFGDSARFHSEDVDLCFIDANHSYEAVVLDSRVAWHNRNKEAGAILWHDYNDRHLGVMQAVDEFTARHGLLLSVLPDSSTVYVTWGV